MLELAILGLLDERPMHGYELRKRLSEMLGTVRTVSFGSLYPTLRRLQQQGDIVEDASAATATRAGPTELRYARQLTLLGLETSERELRWINELIQTENPSQGEPQ